jgi:hypothetical protein
MQDSETEAGSKFTYDSSYSALSINFRVIKKRHAIFPKKFPSRISRDITNLARGLDEFTVSSECEKVQVALKSRVLYH